MTTSAVYFQIFHCVLLTLLTTIPCNALLEGLYCGKENCYDVLGITRDATKTEIVKAYRLMAKKYHPDVHKTAEAKIIAQERFTVIATAYEILRDEEARKDYDYMLDNPDYVYQHYYHYYRRRMAPKVDVRIVIVVTITVISVVQYLNAWQRYRNIIAYLSSVPKYRNKALDLAKKEGYLDSADKKRKKRSKEELKDIENAAIKKVLEENMDIRGGYAKPSPLDVLWIQIIFLPYNLFLYIKWYLRWIWKFTLMGEEYEKEEQLYLIKSYLNSSQTHWDAIDPEEKESYLEMKLWIKENFEEWKKEKEDERKAKLAENAKYKSYRRFMRNHGPGQITFED